jgi:hypothetical protein
VDEEAKENDLRGGNESDGGETHARSMEIVNENHERVTISKAHELNHASCIKTLVYNKFEWFDRDLSRFHRPDMQEVFIEQLQSMQQRHKDQFSRRQNAEFPDYPVVISEGQISFAPGPDGKKEKPLIPQYELHVVTKEEIDMKIKRQGIINSHEYFKDRWRLSLKYGKFCLFEHADQHPLFVNNFGMASKLKRYLYSPTTLPPSAFLRKQENLKRMHMGVHGMTHLRQPGERIP